DADDFAPPHGQSADGADVAELEARVVAAEAALAAAQDALAALNGAGAGADADALASALLGLAGFGVPGAVPLPDGGTAALLAQAGTVLAQGQARLDEGARVRALPAP